MQIAHRKRWIAGEGMKKLHECKKGRITGSGVPGNLGSVFLRNRQGAADRRGSTGAVSYTHLDVYKRQASR